jgi:hypothetical protein
VYHDRSRAPRQLAENLYNDAVEAAKVGLEVYGTDTDCSDHSGGTRIHLSPVPEPAVLPARTVDGGIEADALYPAVEAEALYPALKA